MSLDNVFAEFADDLGPEINFCGPRETEHNAKPPRINWKPTTARHLPARRTQGRPGDDGPILTRQWAILVEIWGVDLADTERLADLFLAAAQRLLTQYSYQPGEETWLPGGQSADGVVCQMTIFIQAPILRTPVPHVKLREIDAHITIGGSDSVNPHFTKEP